MSEKDKTVQQIAISGRDSKQVAGNNNETNRNLFIGIFFLLVLALGGLPLHIVLRRIPGNIDLDSRKKTARILFNLLNLNQRTLIRESIVTNKKFI